MEQYDLIIVGAGASGLMTAISAGEENLKLALIEKRYKSASKLKITGKGRCNITNIAPLNSFIEKFGKNGKFLYRAFSVFFNNNIIKLLEDNGTPCVTERGGRVFPKSNLAIDVVNALLRKLRQYNITSILDTKVIDILTEDKRVIGVITEDFKTKNKKTIYAKNIVIATGGLSYPKTGSDGDGYKFAKKFGHTIIPTKASLVGLDTSRNLENLEGLSFKNVEASLFVDNKKLAKEFGDMLFTKTGISGPIILKLSRLYTSLTNKQNTFISIDLKPALDYKTLKNRIEREFNQNGKMQLKNLLKHLIPNRFIQDFIKYTKINPEKIISQINKVEKTIIINTLKDFKLDIKSIRPIEEAIVTAGGVSLKEINPQTMESKFIKNLYFVGEVLDLDAETGGYNLQSAFSTGYLAGKSIYHV